VNSRLRHAHEKRGRCRAWPFGKASVSGAEASAIARFFRSGHVSVPIRPRHRLTQHVHSKAPSLHPALAGLPNYYEPLRVPTGSRGTRDYAFPHRVELLRSPRRVSQVPRLVFPRALSPTTPESPACARTRYFHADDRLQRFRPHGRSQLVRITRSRGTRDLLALRLAGSLNEASTCRLLGQAARLAACRTGNCIVNTSQFTRPARLALAHQKLRKSAKK